MSCVGCRVLRKGCSDKCPLRSSLGGIEGHEAQGHATVFLSKFFGRAGLTAFCSAVPEAQRPALFQSLLYEACGRTINPVYGSVGLLWSGKWHLCQAAVEKVLVGGQLGPLDQAPLDGMSPPLPSHKMIQGGGAMHGGLNNGIPQANGGSLNGLTFGGMQLNGTAIGQGGLQPYEATSNGHLEHSRMSEDPSGVSHSPPGSSLALNPILMGLQYRDFNQPESRFGGEVNVDPVIYQTSQPLDLGAKLLHSPTGGAFDVKQGAFDVRSFGNAQHFNALRATAPNRSFPM